MAEKDNLTVTEQALSQAMPRMLSASTLEEAAACFVEAASVMGFPGYLLAHRDAVSGWVLESNWPAPFVAAYFGPSGITANPVTLRISSRRSLLWWGDGGDWGGKADAAFLLAACDVGIMSACSIPAFDALGLSVVCHLSSTERIEPNTEISRAMTSLVGLFLNAIRDVGPPPPAGDQRRLTSREVEVLIWAARGASNWQIGERLGISENSVEFHFRNIFDKLEVSNRVSAVVTAIKSGQILP